MLGATVPKAPIDKDGELSPRENDVSFTPHLGQRPNVNSETEPAPMQF
jgi:hypothetical protein